MASAQMVVDDDYLIRLHFPVPCAGMSSKRVQQRGEVDVSETKHYSCQRLVLMLWWLWWLWWLHDGFCGFYAILDYILLETSFCFMGKPRGELTF